MPYPKKNLQRKNWGKNKLTDKFLRRQTPEKRCLIKFGFVPKSLTEPETHQPLTQKLAASAKHRRDEGVAMVKSILSNADESAMDKIKMTQLWKALFYAFWMSDKVLIQQELARRLANFIKLCSSDSVSMLYIECFFECMEREWTGIDYLRMSKFLSLVRYFVHSSFDYLALNEWNLQLVQSFAEILRHKLDLLDSANRGLFLHLNDIYIEELVKVNRVDSDDHRQFAYRPPITFDALYRLLTPFTHFFLESKQMEQQQYVIRKVFHVLMESMHFDKEERELKLQTPGANDLDLYVYDIDEDDKQREEEDGDADDGQMDGFLETDEEEEDEEQEAETEDEQEEEDWMEAEEDADGAEEEEMDVTKVASKRLPRLDDESMTPIDPHNPKRRKKTEKHIIFDKINYDVVMPFKEYQTNGVNGKVNEWQTKFADSNEKRKHDPLLLQEKMDQFHKVFDYLANHEETPKKAARKLQTLAKIFTEIDGTLDEMHEHEMEYFSHDENENDELVNDAQQSEQKMDSTKQAKRYNRKAIKRAVKMVDTTKADKQRKMRKKQKKKVNRLRERKKQKLHKLKKMGFKKVVTDSKFGRRAQKFLS
eukprot:CAMPEP_0197028136 /NCGR_PEP_ID=MMETSP1384-20130603/7901_1 /TAXON_ID=29189 /ORGANISM="Ammonia sp." /LENGTH=593 /DNA_ID=CAMNT_0042457089 /DNA_START=7 /DNA_END=1788 /DNA_ORIENTATION=+